MVDLGDNEVVSNPKGEVEGCIEQSPVTRFLFLAWKDLAHPEAGGSEIFVDELIREFQRRSVDVALICGSPVDQRPYLVLESGSKFGQYLRAPSVVRKARRLGQRELLVEVVNGFPFFTPLWWRGPRLCFFHHVHGEQWFRYFPKPIAAFGWLVECRLLPVLYRRSVFCALSESTAAELQVLGIDPDRIHVVHSGLDETLFEPRANSASDRPGGEPTFVSVGRLAANKGIDRILDAWALYTAQCPGRLLIIGDGPDRGRLEHRQVPNVEFLGRVDEDDKRQIIHEATALLHGAYREGWGMVITEAGALGTPSLAFDADGVRDAIRNGSTGRLVGSSEEMARVLIEISSNEESATTWEAMGVAAKEWASTFTWARTADELLVAAAAAQRRK